MCKRCPELNIEPSTDNKTVVITITDTKIISMQTLIKTLVMTVDHLVKAHGLELSDFKIQPNDKSTEIKQVT